MSVMNERPKMDSDRSCREVRKSAHLNFDGNADLLLDFLGGTPGPLADNGHIIVGNIRIGLDGQVVEGQHPAEASIRSASAITTNRLFSAKSTSLRIIVFSFSLRCPASLIVDRILESDRVGHDLLARLQPG